MKLLNGDCMELLKDIPDSSVQMILCDLPYNTTKNSWDCALNLQELWEHYKRIIRDNGAIVLFSQSPFDKVLACSNLDMLKYEWIWQKESGTGFLYSHFAPMKIHENILVFSKSAACFVKDKSKVMKYYPQKAAGKPYKSKVKFNSSNYDTKWSKEVEVNNTGDRFPVDVLTFNRDTEKLHPTQKPVALCEYLIKTYTDEGDLVLDNCMGCGSSRRAALNIGRDFIGMEKDKKYFDIACNRLGWVVNEAV